MGRAKDIIVKPISSKDANRIIKALHYSGKVTQNSQVHFGVFLDGRCGGAVSFGPSIDKRRTVAIVEGTLWNEFLELNRLALADWLPTNGESRVISVCMRLLKRAYPHLQWVISFADAAQCGDGTIYRASGFVLTSIKKNTQMLQMPDGSIVAKKTLDNPNNMGSDGRFGSAIARENGATLLPGFQLRYIYFLDPTARDRLTVPVIPFSEIEKRGAGMYRGKPRAGSIASDASAIHAEQGGATPTSALLTSEVKL